MNEENKNLIKQARFEYQDDDVRIDDDAKVIEIDEGHWVQAWVLVSKEVEPSQKKTDSFSDLKYNREDQDAE